MSLAAWAEDWLRTVDDRVAWLVREGGADGVVPPLGDGAGLVLLWAWARPRFVRRPAGGVPGELPVWYGDPRAWTPRWWDDETIWLCDAVIAWFATELLSALPGAVWATGHDELEPQRYLHEGQPVVRRLDGGEVHPWTLVANLAGRVWTGTAADTDLLRVWHYSAGMA
ncbi:hypothetical protein [Nocardioides mesophilus]|uniref:Uncharacterized protein n=1 Tax=Nocardioides mesophilus TaxID=433659 RepID=A0A7G9REH2_9ACTN|nr:hypothetical protein [Nocardioides mesophilus]QNN53997.1 hypothetical protein H9L09_06340 [Nocardioides mesophilus]